MIQHTYSPQPIFVPSINFLYHNISKIQPREDFKCQPHSGKVMVKSRSQYDVAHQHSLPSMNFLYFSFLPSMNFPYFSFLPSMNFLYFSFLPSMNFKYFSLLPSMIFLYFSFLDTAWKRFLHLFIHQYTCSPDHPTSWMPWMKAIHVQPLKAVE